MNKNTHMRGDKMVMGEEGSLKTCIGCKQELPISQFYLMRQNVKGVYYTLGRCMSCHNKLKSESSKLRSDYIDIKTDHCMLCEIENDKLELDHCHGTEIVRGFICKNCNTGLGKFNDDPQLLVKAIEYLLKDPIKKPPKKQLDLFEDEMD